MRGDKLKSNKILYITTVLIIINGIISSAAGLFYKNEGSPYNFINQYGNSVKMYGQGLYAHDSYFMAPIFIGTDFTILFIAIPVLLIALILDMKKNMIKHRLFLMSVISVFTYYSASISFGVSYNFLHLVYIFLFSASFFGLITAITSIDLNHLKESIKSPLPYKGIYFFLILTGTALFIAWLPDIISSLIKKQSLELIEVYTTAITYVIDMGIISPVAFICIAKLVKKDGFGFILLSILLTLCCIIGIMLPVQTAYQIFAGIDLPLAAIITKMGIFVLLAFFACYFNIKLFRSIN